MHFIVNGYSLHFHYNKLLHIYDMLRYTWEYSLYHTPATNPEINLLNLKASNYSKLLKAAKCDFWGALV